MNVRRKQDLRGKRWQGFLLLVAMGIGIRTSALEVRVNAQPTFDVEKVLKVGKAFSHTPAGFDLLTHETRQFAAYYDAERQLVVASRKLGSDKWTKTRLRERVNWDSHNYIEMAIDRRGHLHLAANMHVDPLTYYRTTEPLDVTTFERLNRMVGQNEERCTYPVFMRGPHGRLLFGYRDGSSGRGKRIFNVYDAEKQSWKRLLDEPLLDGAGEMNAYPIEPRRGPNGLFHIVWMWRNTPDADTNHDISYMRSSDLKHWETADEARLNLPVTPKNEQVVVDPVPPNAGLLNTSFALGFDHENRPIVSYHKYDDGEDSQIYNARWEKDHWEIFQTSNFDFRWEFGGGGSLPGPKVTVRGVRALGEGRLIQSYQTLDGGGTWQLDPETLLPTGHVHPPGYALPKRLQQPRSDFPGMQVRWVDDSGQAPEANVRYKLRRESLGSNRDRRPEGNLPDPCLLELYKLVEPPQPG